MSKPNTVDAKATILHIVRIKAGVEPENKKVTLDQRVMQQSQPLVTFKRT